MKTKPSVQLRIPDGALCSFAHIVKTSSLTKLHLRVRVMAAVVSPRSAHEDQGTAGSRNATGDALCKILKECKGLTDVDIVRVRLPTPTPIRSRLLLIHC